MKKPIPYLTLVTTNVCNFKCPYCSPVGDGRGEGYRTENQRLDLGDIKKKLRIAWSEGVTKIRLTGGEPLMVPETMEILKFLENKTNFEYALVTNGSLVHKFIDEFERLPRLSLRISLDSLKEKSFFSITKKDSYKRVIKNVKILAEKKILDRVQMVVSKENISEVNSMIKFCEKSNVDLKLLEMYTVPETKGYWKSNHVSLEKTESMLKKRMFNFEQEAYTKSFGIPTFFYKLPGKITVMVKDSRRGTKYSGKLCEFCRDFPCQEGLYTIFYSSNQKLIPCRFSPVHFEAGTLTHFRRNLKKLIELFHGGYHQIKFSAQDYEF